MINVTDAHASDYWYGTKYAVFRVTGLEHICVSAVKRSLQKSDQTLLSRYCWLDLIGKSFEFDKVY